MQENSTRGIRVVLLLTILMLVTTTNAQFYTIRPTVIDPSKARNDELNSKADTDTLNTTKVNTETTKFQASLPLSKSLYITSPYGYRLDPFTGKKKFHKGLDLRCDNEKVIAMFNGKVKRVGYEKRGFGHFLVLSHPPFEVTYAHLEYVLVEKGDNISAGDVVAVSGNSGRSTGPHLHIELRYRGKRCNPLPLLAFLDRSTRIYNKIKPTIMQRNQESLTALEHVQEAYADEYLAFLLEEKLVASEESAILFLERIEQDIITS